MSRDRLALEGPEGTLEAVLEGETENPAMIAIVCHPHPQFGGTMDNKVVTTLIRAARDAGAAALRFNFRGVGESQGAYSDGIGEVEDLIAVHRWLSKKYPGTPLWLAGFSFGSFVAACRGGWMFQVYRWRRRWLPVLHPTLQHPPRLYDKVCV